MEGLGRVGEAFTFSSCQNYGPFFGYPTVNIRCRIIIRTQTGDHNFDNHPDMVSEVLGSLRVLWVYKV